MKTQTTGSETHGCSVSITSMNHWGTGWYDVYFYNFFPIKKESFKLEFRSE